MFLLRFANSVFTVQAWKMKDLRLGVVRFALGVWPWDRALSHSLAHFHCTGFDAL